MGTGFAKRKKQAKMLQEQFAQMQEKLGDTKATGQAANGLVSVTLNGNHELLDLKIKPECVDPEDVEGLEDLIKLAYKEALEKIQEESGDKSLGGGLPDLSGLAF